MSELSKAWREKVSDKNYKLKAISRKEIENFINLAFPGYEETYGEEADAKLASWQQIKTMNEVAKKIIKMLGIKRSELSSDLAVELVSETYYDLVEVSKILEIRIKIAKIMEQHPDFDEEWRGVFAQTNDLDLLQAILFMLENNPSNEVIPLLEEIYNLGWETGFFDNYVEDFFAYFQLKKDFPFPVVTEFLDSNFYMFSTNDGMDDIITILEEYSTSNLKLPFSEETRKRFERNMPFLIDSGVFDKKDEESLIRLINGVFIWLNRIPQLGKQSFPAIVDVEAKLDRRKVKDFSEYKK